MKRYIIKAKKRNTQGCFDIIKQFTTRKNALKFFKIFSKNDFVITEVFDNNKNTVIFTNKGV